MSGCSQLNCKQTASFLCLFNRTDIVFCHRNTQPCFIYSFHSQNENYKKFFVCFFFFIIDFFSVLSPVLQVATDMLRYVGISVKAEKKKYLKSLGKCFKRKESMSKMHTKWSVSVLLQFYFTPKVSLEILDFQKRKAGLCLISNLICWFLSSWQLEGRDCVKPRVSDYSTFTAFFN